MLKVIHLRHFLCQCVGHLVAGLWSKSLSHPDYGHSAVVILRLRSSLHSDTQLQFSLEVKWFVPEQVTESTSVLLNRHQIQRPRILRLFYSPSALITANKIVKFLGRHQPIPQFKCSSDPHKLGMALSTLDLVLVQFSLNQLNDEQKLLPAF